MGRPSREVIISDTEATQLRDLELGAGVHPKVRLRASLLRLHREGWNVPRLAKHFARSEQSVHTDLTRFEQHGLLGLTEAQRPGRPLKLTPTHEAVIETKLQEERLWTAVQLAEVLSTDFALQVTAQTVRHHLSSLGYSWKRARYVPDKPLDPETRREHEASLETLKRGHWTAS